MNEGGLYGKYIVERLDDSEGKHKDCAYFVLDLTHDIFARMAIRTYALVCKQDSPQLSAELQKLADNLSMES